MLIDLSKLSNVVKNDVFKKTVYDKTSRFASKTQNNAEKLRLEKKIDDADEKIPYTSGLVKKQTIMLR